MEQHNEQIRARITGTGNLLREIFACLFPVLGTLYAFSHAAVVLYLCAEVTGGYLPFGTCVPQPMWILLYFLAALGSSYLSAGRCLFLNADKHSPVSSARSTKRRVMGMRKVYKNISELCKMMNENILLKTFIWI